MALECTRQILPNARDFKQFWKAHGPFKYALTSRDFPPMLLAPEEWLFGNDKIEVLKALMGFSTAKMAFVQSPFNPDNKAVLRPSELSQWKITHFPVEWNQLVCAAFVPEGHLTQAVMDELQALGLDEGKAGIEAAFFSLLEQELDLMGYVWLRPEGESRSASIRSYLEEWEQDDADAGLT